MQIGECMFGNGLKVGWLKPFQYISAYSFIAHDKSRILTPVFKTAPIQALKMYHTYYTSVRKYSY
jgi:hypothetical protein